MSAGKLDEAEIIIETAQAMTRRLDADQKNLPNALPVRCDLLKLAKEDATAYFRATFQIEGS